MFAWFMICVGALALVIVWRDLRRNRRAVARALRGDGWKNPEIKRLRTEAMAELMEGNERAAMLYTEQADALEGPIADLTVRRFYSPDEQGRVKIIVPTNFQ